MTEDGRESVNHPWFARAYMRAGGENDEEHRKALLKDLTGTVIEIGCGHGLNFPFYPGAVQRVLAVEPEPTLRQAAATAAGQAPVPIQVVDGMAERLPAQDGEFDVGIASLVLCSVTDQRRALAEIRRVIRPDGELRFYEHVASRGSLIRTLQRLADAVFWPRLAGGCHLGRETEAAIGEAGFELESSSRFSFSPQRPAPPIPHILGRARRP